VLSIVQGLNENIYQVAVNWTDEWEKLGASRTTSQIPADPTSGPRVPTLVWLVLNRGPMSLDVPLQSCL
jgi:hypothetical protein